MPEFEFDVDASIAAGWERFASRLAGFLRVLVPGATFELEVPFHAGDTDPTPSLRFAAVDAGTAAAVEVEVTGGVVDDEPPPLCGSQLDQLADLGWSLPGGGAPGARPHLRMPAVESSHLAHLIAGTMERVFGVPHPVFLHDVVGTATSGDGTAGGEPAHGETAPSPTRSPDSASDDADFRPLTITDPDQATRAVAAALADVYGGRVESDQQDVFTVPAGCVVLFVRVHRSMPLVVFRSPLIQAVEDAAAAETEVAILNRDSLWCRYVFDGKTIYAEAEFVDRVFVPVNFKIQLTEMSAEIDDVYPDLARRVAGKQWRDLHSADDPGHDRQ